MIITLQKLLQKAKQVSDPRDAHALALDLVESMLRHYAVVAIAAYRHAGAKDPKINRILSEQLLRPSMGSWKNFIQALAAADVALFPERFGEEFLKPFTRKGKDSAVSLAYADLKRCVEQSSAIEKAPLGKLNPIECTPLEFFGLMVTYRNRFAGHGTQILPDANLELASILLKGIVAMCNHLRPVWLAFPVYVAKQASLYGGMYSRLIPLVDGGELAELKTSDKSVVSDRLYLCFGERKHPETAGLFPLALWQEEDILFANGAKDMRDIRYIGYVNQQSFETDIYADDFRVFLDPFATQEKTSTAVPTPAPTIKPQPSIVVLPFVNMSSDPEQEYFCDGMAEEIINALTHVESLHVVARTSAFSFRGRDIDVREIGRKLDVAHVLEGSVRKSGNRLRITAQLIKVEDGYHLWSERFDRNMEDVFAIQDEISLAVVRELKVRLLKAEETAVVKRHTVDTEAYELYLKGRYFWNKRDEVGLKKGIECFQQAIVKDPYYALAYAGIADCYNHIGFYGYMSPREAYSQAKMALDKALELDSMLAEAHFSSGLYKMHFAWDFSGSEKEFKRALELNPNSATIRQQYSCFLGIIMGKFDEAITEIQRARQLDPLSVLQITSVGLIYTFARRYNEAMEHYQMALEMDPYFLLAHRIQGLNFAGLKMWEKAIAASDTAKTISAGSTNSIGNLGYVYAIAGHKDKAFELLDQLDKLSEERYVSPYYKAFIFAGLDDRDRAFSYLEKAFAEREPQLIMLKVYQVFDSIRDDPRFHTLLKKIGLPE